MIQKRGLEEKGKGITVVLGGEEEKWQLLPERGDRKKKGKCSSSIELIDEVGKGKWGNVSHLLGNVWLPGEESSPTLFAQQWCPVEMGGMSRMQEHSPLTPQQRGIEKVAWKNGGNYFLARWLWHLASRPALVLYNPGKPARSYGNWVGRVRSNSQKSSRGEVPPGQSSVSTPVQQMPGLRAATEWERKIFLLCRWEMFLPTPPSQTPRSVYSSGTNTWP